MSDHDLDVEAWLRRIAYTGPRTRDLGSLNGIVLAQTTSIAYENLDVLLGRVPKLDIPALQRKMIDQRRGGYCFELNALLRAGLVALGFDVTPMIARVVRSMAPDAPVLAGHMVLRVDLPEGAFLIDAGFGNLTPTAAVAMTPDITQPTPHEPMRLRRLQEDLLLEAKTASGWEALYRVLPQSCLDVDYDVINWFTATHPNSPFVGNAIAALSAPGGVRHSFFNGRLSLRRSPEQPGRRILSQDAEYQAAFRDIFGLALSAPDLAGIFAALDRSGARGSEHPFFM